jgi:hypothetical protein
MVITSEPIDVSAAEAPDDLRVLFKAGDDEPILAELVREKGYSKRKIGRLASGWPSAESLAPAEPADPDDEPEEDPEAPATTPEPSPEPEVPASTEE